MKTKLFAFISCIMCTLLVACGQNSLDGKYYSIRKGETVLVLEIDGEAGKYYDSGTVYPVTVVDQENRQITVSGFRDVVMMYELSDTGQMTMNAPGWSGERTYYKENSTALKQAIEETQKENE